MYTCPINPFKSKRKEKQGNLLCLVFANIVLQIQSKSQLFTSGKLFYLNPQFFFYKIIPIIVPVPKYTTEITKK